MKSIYIKAAGIINLLTSFIHLVGGQITLVNPLHNSNLEIQQKAEWISAWHIITILLFYTSYLLLRAGFTDTFKDYLKPIGILYILIGIPFILSSIFYSVFAPQWILLLPIGILTMYGLRERNKGL